MATEDLVMRLASVPMFSGCSKKELQTIAKTVRQIEHPAGTAIATEGEPGAGLSWWSNAERRSADDGWLRSKCQRTIGASGAKPAWRARGEPLGTLRQATLLRRGKLLCGSTFVLRKSR